MLVDQSIRWEGTGAKATRVMVPPSPEVLKGVRDIVASIAGYDEKRGDQLTIETVPFETTLTIEAPSPAAKPAPPVQGLGLKQPVVIGGAVLGVLIMAGAFLLLRRKGGKITSPEQTAIAAIAAPYTSASGPQGADSASIMPGLGPAAVPSTSGDAGQHVLSSATAARISIPAQTGQTELIANNIRALVEKDPSATANILKGWIADGSEDET